MTLPDLITRLEAASEGSRELDLEIFCLVDEPGAVALDKHGLALKVRGGITLAPSVTTSLDAAIALCEAKLPGWEWFLNMECGRYFAELAGPKWGRGQPDNNSQAAAPSLALCAAILRATQPKDPNNAR